MWKKNWSLTGMSLAAIVFYAVCGLLLLLLPTEALAIANYAIAALLLVMGVVCVIGYFRGSVEGGSGNPCPRTQFTSVRTYGNCFL